MDRTIIICNTSSMPVAAREASIYMGITLAEYYRQMGLNVLLIADSTSRWAQAMRETSGRMEEIPGEEAFPAYLDSSIKSVYERAGVIRFPDGSQGSLTMIGTVSPAGGNFEEPVTQSTLGTVKTFLGLSYDRAYKRFYPAIDPLLSWSRYLDQLAPWLSQNLADFVFIYLGYVDIAGHDYGWMSEAYLAGVANADRCIGRVMETLPRESTVIVTSDHGGHARTHGTDCDEDMTIPFIISGPGILSGQSLGPVSITDIAPTVAALLGLQSPAEWTGRALNV